MPVILMMLLSGLPIISSGKGSCPSHRYYAYISDSGHTALLFDQKFGNYKAVSSNISMSEMVTSGSDIGGNYINCDTSRYYCVGLSFSILIPKNLNQPVWGDRRNRCSSIYEDDVKKFTVYCMDEHGVVTRFIYSKRHGIQSFTRLVPKGPKYISSGVCGIFANGEGEEVKK